jgi:hypothetical protein
MTGNTDQCPSSHEEANFIGCRFNPESRERRQVLQPMQPWPDWMGKLTPLFQRITPQALYVTGPRQPIL